jgi:hypothetical protein
MCWPKKKRMIVRMFSNEFGNSHSKTHEFEILSLNMWMDL